MSADKHTSQPTIRGNQSFTRGFLEEHTPRTQTPPWGIRVRLDGGGLVVARSPLHACQVARDTQVYNIQPCTIDMIYLKQGVSG